MRFQAILALLATAVSASPIPFNGAIHSKREAVPGGLGEFCEDVLNGNAPPDALSGLCDTLLKREPVPGDGIDTGFDIDADVEAEVRKVRSSAGVCDLNPY